LGTSSSATTLWIRGGIARSARGPAGGVFSRRRICQSPCNRDGQNRANCGALRPRKTASRLLRQAGQAEGPLKTRKSTCGAHFGLGVILRGEAIFARLIFAAVQSEGLHWEIPSITTIIPCLLEVDLEGQLDGRLREGIVLWKIENSRVVNGGLICTARFQAVGRAGPLGIVVFSTASAATTNSGGSGFRAGRGLPCVQRQGACFNKAPRVSGSGRAAFEAHYYRGKNCHSPIKRAEGLWPLPLTYCIDERERP